MVAGDDLERKAKMQAFANGLEGKDELAFMFMLSYSGYEAPHGVKALDTHLDALVEALQDNRLDVPPSDEQLLSLTASAEENVTQIQTLLRDLDHPCGNHGVNGDGVDGICGKDTTRVMKKAAQKLGIDENIKIPSEEFVLALEKEWDNKQKKQHIGEALEEPDKRKQISAGEYLVQRFAANQANPSQQKIDSLVRFRPDIAMMLGDFQRTMHNAGAQMDGSYSLADLNNFSPGVGGQAPERELGGIG
jgi:hypothetical protein